MRRNTFTAVWGFIILISGICYSQSVHVITAQDFTFSPQNVTVTVGDTVRWRNVQGHHNVRADNNSFTSGLPAPAPWTYNHVFTSAGNNPYYCEPHGTPGGGGMSGVVIVQNPVSVPGDETIAEIFELNQNYPNPFNPTTKISYQSPVSSWQTLRVYDILGNEVATLVNEEKPAGYYEVEFDASDLTSGIYYYRINAGNYSETKKMILLK